MASPNPAKYAGLLQDPEKIRAERDRGLALVYEAKGKTRSAIPEIAEETGLNLRTVYRAVNRGLRLLAKEREASPVEGAA